ncbi:hypothetical protein [Pseudonocardia sp. GCM10023141]|uniref:hypothetical protein n=1 Tax=Pseudonocardia sp. GCM10023141 TaxID=3252653 RepID=UPI003610AF46
MSSLEDVYAGLTRAADALGVTSVAAGPDDADSHSTEFERTALHRLALAGAVSGAAEALIMVQTSALINRDDATPATDHGYDDVELAALVDRVAFRAAGMTGSDAATTHGLWLLWWIRRLQIHNGELRRWNTAHDLRVVEGLLCALHDLLSGFVHGDQGNIIGQRKCRTTAHGHLASALETFRQRTSETNL